jgi:SAM-dependent methyltransferase
MSEEALNKQYAATQVQPAQMTEYQRQRNEQQIEAILAVKAKLASGEYATEPTRCFCGSDNDKLLREYDRLGIPHRIVVCQECALVRVNPRMTAEAYGRFYNEEYRKFTYRWLDTDPLDREHELALIRDKQRGVGHHLHDRLVAEDIEFPATVLDFGCYLGGMLDHFKDKGAETYGVELNAEAREFAIKNGHAVVADIDELIAKGVKVDLVIMQDVIEHMLDLWEVQKIAQVLKPGGYVYIFTPGMFRTDPNGYWQLAHTWYFVANTFGWLMEELGFTPTYIDEDITSFWQWQGNVVHMEPPTKEWVEYIVDEAEGKEERKLPPFRGVCKFNKKLLYDNMRRNFALKPPDIHSIRESRTGPIAIVGGGPSIDGQVDKLVELQAAGVPVIAIARMYPWLLKHGIRPDYVVSLDCMEEQEKGFALLCSETTHLMASVTRPEIVERIQKFGAPIYLFDSRDDRKIKDLRRQAGYEVCTVINSGGTVVITCMSIAFVLGYTDLHIFGFDCMIPNPEHTHAEGIAGESVEQLPYVVTINGESVVTTPSFLEFARQSLDLFSVAHEEGILKSVKVYGDSLITRMWDCKWYNEDGSEQVAA